MLGSLLAAGLAAGMTGGVVTPAAAAGTPGGGTPSLEDFSRTAANAYEAGIDAYVWGYPLVVMRRTQAVMTCRGDVNELMHSARLYTADDRDVVTPNNDTIYTMAWLDLRSGPQRLVLPEAGDRYFSFQFLDMFTNTFHIAHGGEDGPAEVLIVGPDWRGPAPDGVQVVKAPTPDVWAIGRTFVEGTADLDAAKAFQQQYQLHGPDGERPVPEGTDCASLPTPQSVSTAGVGFFDELGEVMAANPAPRDETGLVKKLERAGIGAGLTPSQTSDPAVRTALTAAVTAGESLMDQRGRQAGERVNGWSYNLDIGRYGDDYVTRAWVAEVGLGALPAEEALYFSATTDSAGQPLSGATSYVLHFPAGSLPPLEETGFWSLTMYDGATRFLADNPNDRYAINSANRDLVYNADGSLDLYISNQPPAGHESNWLPAPAGRFYMILRTYLPTADVLDGTWQPPALTVG